MTRDEVLKAVEIATEEASAAAVGLKCTGQGRAFTWYSKQADLLRAAAELIRAGGWRPIADAPPKLNWALCGRWNGQIWEEVESSPKECAELGWTHYFVVPAPPAREVPNE